MKPKKRIQLFMAALTLAVLMITALFVDSYSQTFDNFGALAKERLIKYPIYTFFFTPIAFWISAYLCRRYSPFASGHYLQVALDQIKKDSPDAKSLSPFLNFRLIVVKTLSSLISTLGGGALGKEGPSIHIAAGVFTIFSERFKKFLPPFHAQSWILAGSAIGLMMVFNAPLAGAAFAFEKLAKIGKRYKESIFLITLSVAITTIIFYSPTPTFHFYQVHFSITDCWKFFLLTSVICTIFALATRLLCFRFFKLISSIKSNWWHLAPLLIGLVVAYLNYRNGIYSFSGGIQTIEHLLAGGEILSANEVIGRMLNTALTFASGSAGGLIAPAIALGIGLGSILSDLATNIDIGVFFLVGMVSFLSIVIGEPIAAALIIFESMGQTWQTLPFLLLASYIPQIFSKIFKKYE